MNGKQQCPPTKVNFDDIVEAATKAVLKGLPSCKTPPVAGSVNVLGVKLAESPLKPVELVLGFATLPQVVNFATKLSQVGVLLPQVDLGISRGVALGGTLLATVLSGGSSFLVGALVGQIPTTMDSLFDIFISPIVRARLAPQAPPPAVPAQGGSSQAGIGATDEEQLRKLREDLERMSGAEVGDTLVVRR